MPLGQFPSVADKVVNGRLVPSARFNLSPARLKTVGHFGKLASEVRSNINGLSVTRIEHPILSSIELATNSQTQTNSSLPVLETGDETILKDAVDPALHWIVPTIRTRPLSADDPDAFRVLSEGLDEQGNSVFSAVLSIPIERVPDENAHQLAQSEALSSGEHVTTRDIEIIPEECRMHITHNVAGEIERMTINGTITDNGRHAEFHLLGSAIAITFDALTAVGERGLQIEVFGRFDAYKHVTPDRHEQIFDRSALATKVDLSKSLLSQADLSVVRVLGTKSCLNK